MLDLFDKDLWEITIYHDSIEPDLLNCSTEVYNEWQKNKDEAIEKWRNS